MYVLFGMEYKVIVMGSKLCYSGDGDRVPAAMTAEFLDVLGSSSSTAFALGVASTL
jgi:hypothetical protein